MSSTSAQTPGRVRPSAPPAPSVAWADLTELRVFQRFALALRASEVDRAELVALLREDLAWLDHGTASAADPKAVPGSAAPTDAVADPTGVTPTARPRPTPGRPGPRPARRRT